MYARDIFAKQFLLSYLVDEDGRLETWISSDPQNVPRGYSHVEILK